jgi:hypothetical protein
MSLRQESYPPWFQPRTIAVVVIAGAAVWCTSIVVGGWRATRSPEMQHRLGVTGTATQHVTPDRISWTATIHARSSDRDSAQSDLHDAVVKARDYLTSHGVKDAELAFKPSSVEENTPTADDGSSGVTEYDASQELLITSSDVKGALAAYRDAAIAEDLTGADIAEPTCTFSGIAAVEQKLLSQARHDARAKAEASVADYGGHLASLLDAEPGAFDPATNGVEGCSGGEATATATAAYEID